MVRRGTPCAAALCVIAGSGCAPSDHSVEFVSRDSAGVVIHTTTGDPPHWHIDSEPILQLGTIDEAGPAQFFRIVDVALLPDGGLAVANQGSDDVRIFNPDGTHRATTGRRGRGPEEFTGLALVAAFADSLMTWDSGNARVSIRRGDGGFVRSFQLEWSSGILFPVALVERDTELGKGHRILAVTARYMSELQGTGLVVDTALLSLHDMNGMLVDSMSRIPHNARIVHKSGDFQTTLSAPFTTHAAIAGGSGGFCYAFGPQPDITCRRDRGTEIIRVSLPDRHVTESDIADYWDDAFAKAPANRRAALERMRPVLPFPDRFPAYAQLARDDGGRLWARRYPQPTATDEEWLIFNDGMAVGRVTSPRGFRVMDVRGNRMAGVWHDSLGVEYVRVYHYEMNGAP